MLIICDSLPSIQWSPLDQFDGNQLAIFKIAVREQISVLPYLTSLLQVEEQQRSLTYHRHVDQQRFLVARASLRIILSRYTNQPPYELQIATNKNGKPVLAAFPKLHYNVSHTKDCILIAVFEREVGIDVEAINPKFSFEEIVKQSFSVVEQEYMKREVTGAQDRFYQLWTRKEAFVKATGEGISSDFYAIPSLDGYHYLSNPASKLISTSQSWLVRSFRIGLAWAATAYVASEPPAAIKFYEVKDSMFINP